MEISLTTLEPIRQSYEQGRLRFIVGAGASMAAGLPGWGELNERLIAGYFNASVSDAEQLFGGYSDEELEVIARKFTDEFSKDAVIDLLRERMDAEEGSFVEELHNSLYDGVSGGYQLQALHYELAAILNDCVAREHRGVLYTFNYDDILQTALSTFGIDVTTATDDTETEGASVVHLHGFLPLQRNPDGTPRVEGRIVLSEKDYFDSDGAVADRVLSKLFKSPETDVLLLGMSMADPRIRRLLNERVKAADAHSGEVWALLTRRRPDPDDDVANRRATRMAAAHVLPYWESSASRCMTRAPGCRWVRCAYLRPAGRRSGMNSTREKYEIWSGRCGPHSGIFWDTKAFSDRIRGREVANERETRKIRDSEEPLRIGFIGYDSRCRSRHPPGGRDLRIGRKHLRCVEDPPLEFDAIA